jgi:hypothetical protein
MKKKRAFVLASVLITALGAAAATGVFFLRAQEASALGDPRQGDYGDTLLNPLIARLSAWARGGGAGITAGRGSEAIEEGTLGVGDGGEDRSIKRLSKVSP